jgi:ABC-type branched-subunit amino acid transport system substrate-binding protein
MRQSRFWLATPVAVAFLAAWVLACAGIGGPGERAATEEERRAYEVATESLPDDPVAARAGLASFVRQYPTSALADAAAMLLADLALAQGDPEDAGRWLRWLVTNHPTGKHSDAARLALARIDRDAGNEDEARALLSRLRFSRLSDAQRVESYRLLADLSADPVERLRWLAQLRASQSGLEGKQSAVDDEIDALLAGMSAEELERAADQLTYKVPAARVRLRLAERAQGAGNWQRAEEALAEAERLERVPRDDVALERLLLTAALQQELSESQELLPTFAEVAALPLPRTEGAVGTIGVVLPLTGSFAEYGAESLRGLLLAARIFESPARNASEPATDARAVSPAPSSPAALGWAENPLLPQGIRLVIRDSAGDPDKAARAVRDLASDESVVAIVGPLLSAEAEAAAAVAEEEGVPLLTLTTRREVAKQRSQVFRFRTTPADEIHFLVEHAVEVLGARRFAILYPRDNYGRGMRKRFYQAVEERGLHVVALSSYDPTANDFAESIRSLIGYSLLTRLEKKALEERRQLLRRARRLPPEEASYVREVIYGILGPEGEPLPPIVDFDALFIPDSHDKIVLIAPQLAFHEIDDVRLLGSGGWNDPELVSIARKHVAGAVISAPFDPKSRFLFVSDFVERYSDTFGETPDVFAAQAFDVGNLVLRQLASGVDTRSELRVGVLETRGYPGASGVITMMPDGNARKRPFLLGVRGSRIVSLD